MRRNDILFETFENIKILLQYFYLSEEHKIIKKGPFGNTEIRMTENLEFRGLNKSFDDLPEMDFTSSMSVAFMAALIEELKKEEPIDFKNKFKNRWEEICAITLCNLSFNKKR
jgi:hypothetical protein